MTLPHVVILGVGGHARVVIEAIRLSGIAEIVAAIDSNSALHGRAVAGVTVLGGDDQIRNAREAGATHFIVGVGSVGRTDARQR